MKVVNFNDHICLIHHIMFIKNHQMVNERRFMCKLTMIQKKIHFCIFCSYTTVIGMYANINHFILIRTLDF